MFHPVVMMPMTVCTSLSPGNTAQNQGMVYTVGKYSTTVNVTSSVTPRNACMTALTVF